MNELEALLALSNIPNLGPVKIRSLINYFGSATSAFSAESNEVREIPGFGEKLISAWNQRYKDCNWKRQFELAHLHGIEIIPFTHPQYPKRLLEIPDHPLLLYIKGELDVLNHKSIAIVGTRNCTIYGMEMAQKFAEELTAMGITVISGLARGIDTAAHHGALLKGKTIAIIGSGLSRIYPRENLLLAKNVIQNGALISEFPIDKAPERRNFPQRNRIVSGMATSGVILIEAPEKSGAMITVEKALSQNRNVFTIPGRADMKNFCGNHYLIKKGLARLIENPQEIANFLDPLLKTTLKTTSQGQKSPLRGNCLLSKEESDLLLQLPHHELSIDEIAIKTKIPISQLSILLMNLLLKQFIKEFPGKVYKKLIK